MGDILCFCEKGFKVGVLYIGQKVEVRNDEPGIMAFDAPTTEHVAR